MALQGTIDLFPLTDVLGMIGASQRSGRLVVDGDRGRSVLWVREGAATASDGAGSGPNAADVIAVMLRNTEASFEFDTRSPDATAVAVEARPLPECVEEAHAVVQQWEAIEAIVPSPAHRLELVAEIPTSLTVSPEEWSVLVRCGVARSVASIGVDLGLADLVANARAVALVERGLLSVVEPEMVAASTPGSVGEAPLVGDTGPLGDTGLPGDTGLTGDIGLPGDIGALGDAGASGVPVGLDGAAPAPAAAFPDHFPIDDLVGSDPVEPAAAWSAPTGDLPTDGSFGDSFGGAESIDAVGGVSAAIDPLSNTTGLDATGLDGTAPATTGPDAAAWPEPGDGVSAPAGEWAEPVGGGSDEVMRQMANLSPKAAEAIAEALNSPASSSGDSTAQQPADPAAGTFDTSEAGSWETPAWGSAEDGEWAGDWSGESQTDEPDDSDPDQPSGPISFLQSF